MLPSMAAPTERLLPIGRFARLTGLTIRALRHYDELGLLAPAWIDPETGFRFYGIQQMQRAGGIKQLRGLELALEADDAEDWDVPFAYEALARAHAVAGDAAEARRYVELARADAGKIAEPEDRELVLADLETIPV